MLQPGLVENDIPKEKHDMFTGKLTEVEISQKFQGLFEPLILKKKLRVLNYSQGEVWSF